MTPQQIKDKQALSDKVSITREQLKKSGEKSLLAYAENPVGKILKFKPL